MLQDLKFWPLQPGSYPTTPVAIATNIINTIYPHSEKYQNLQKPSDTFANKFFGSETLSTKFAETFSENYQNAEGINFANYECQKTDGYQDLSGTTVEYGYSEVRNRKKKKKGIKKWFM